LEPAVLVEVDPDVIPLLVTDHRLLRRHQQNLQHLTG
jgi:hypothetical protein